MKILIMGFSKIKYMPYINFYLDCIDCNKHQVHILYWNRDLKQENIAFLENITRHEFYSKQEDDVEKFKKIHNFIKYRSYAKKVISKEKFDFIIVLHSLPAVLMCDSLCREFKDKFIFDYRDSTYEEFVPFKYVIGKLVKASNSTFVSSDAFRYLLPDECNEKIYTSHNMLMDSLLHRDEKQKYGIVSDKIRVSFWGFIRNEKINRELIRKIAHDPRFELHYYGREQQIAFDLKRYVNEIGASNVFFHGEYKPEDRYEFVRNTDIIHNIYQDANMKIAISNKYYDSITFRVPLISMKNSFMADMAEKAEIGFAVDPFDEEFSEKLYSAYCSLDKSEFDNKCDNELSRVYNEYCQGKDVIKGAIFGKT